ncbi:MAG TPA: hypothetical protein VGM29_19910 [Polyangiaceae bacterium]|jgi:hypothetical protein
MAERYFFQARLLVAAALTAGYARAEPGNTLETARRLFHEASELEQSQAWSAAAAKLREALAIKDTPGLRFHLGHCEEQSGELVEAQRDYLRATALIQSGASAPDVEKLLPDASAALKRRIPTLLIVPAAGLTDARIEVDGVALDPLSHDPLSLNPTSHRVVATSSSGQRVEQVLTLTEAEQRVLRLGPPPAAAPPPSPAAAPPVPISQPKTPVNAPHSGSAARSYLLLGESALTLVGLGVGIGYAFARSSATDRALDAQHAVASAAMGNSGACATPSGALAGSCHDFSDAIDARQRDGTIEVIGFVGAGVSASALVATWFFLAKRDAPEQALRYTPWLSKDACGLRGTF